MAAAAAVALTAGLLSVVTAPASQATPGVDSGTCPTAAASFESGDGTLATPYRITTPAHFQLLRDSSSLWDKNFELGANINMGGCVWGTSIGDGVTANFSGFLDGRNHIVSGLSLDLAADYGGLIGYLATGGTVRNIGFTGNVTNTRSKSNSNLTMYTGALVGVADVMSTISNSFTTGTVTASGTADKPSGRIGNLTTTVVAGGLIGLAEASTSDSYSAGNVVTSATVTGSTSGSQHFAIVYAGGFAGQMGRVNLSRGYSLGSVQGSATAATSTQRYVGGFTGSFDEFNSIVTDSFWNTETSGLTVDFGSGTTSGATGLTTAEMKTLATYTNASWPISSSGDPIQAVWGICPAANDGYPFIAGQYSCAYPVVVTANSPASIGYGTAIPSIGYTSNPATTVADWSTEPTCGVYAASDTQFATPLTGSAVARGTYVTHCSGGAGPAFSPVTYIDGSLTITVGTQPALTVTSTSGPVGSPLALTTSGGASFRLPSGWTTVLPADGSMFTAVSSSADGQHLVAGASNGFVFTSANHGDTWTLQTGTPAEQWRHIVSSADGSKLLATTANSAVYSSSDFGATWAQELQITAYRPAMSDDGSVQVVPEWGGYLWKRTANSGWVRLLSAEVRQWTGVAMSADGTRIAASTFQEGVFTSTDSGATWVQRTAAPYAVSIASSADGLTLLVGGEPGPLFTSYDGGATWQSRISAGFQYWEKVAMSADGSVMTAADSSYLWTSRDSGVTWAQDASAGGGAWASFDWDAAGNQLVAADSPQGIKIGPAGTTYTVTNGTATGCAISPSTPYTLSASSRGTCVVTASRAGNLDYAPVSSAATDVTFADAPAPPSGLTVTPGVNASVSFTAPDNGGAPITNYEYSLDGGTWTAVSPASTSTTISLPALSAGVAHSVSVRAVNVAGKGTASSSAPVWSSLVDSYLVQVLSSSYPSVPQLYGYPLGGSPTGPLGSGFPAGRPGAMAVDASRNKVFYISDSPAQLVVLDLATQAFSTPATLAPSGMTLESCSGIAVDDDGSLWAMCVKDDGRRVAVHITDPLGTPTLTAGSLADWAVDFAVDPSGDLWAFGQNSRKARVNRGGFTVGSVITTNDATGGMHFDFASNGDLYIWYPYHAGGPGVRITSAATGVQGPVQTWSGYDPDSTNTIAAALGRVLSLGAPGEPTGLSVTLGDPSVVSFTAPSAGDSPITGYQVSVDGGTWTAATMVAGQTAVELSGLAAGRLHEVRVRAVNSQGASFASATVLAGQLRDTYWVQQNSAPAYNQAFGLYSWAPGSEPFGPESPPFQLTGPYAMAVDATNQKVLYLTDEDANRIVSFDLATRTYSQPLDITGETLKGCYGVGLDNDGSLWAACRRYTGYPIIAHITDPLGAPQVTTALAPDWVRDYAVNPAGALVAFGADKRAVVNRQRMTFGASVALAGAPEGRGFDYASNGDLYTWYGPWSGGGLRITSAATGVQGSLQDWASSEPSKYSTFAASLAREISVGAPGVPTNLVAVNGDPATVTFTAPTAGTSAITGYELSIDGGAWTTAVVLASGTAVEVPAASSDAPREVRIRALNQQGTGLESLPVLVGSLEGTYWVNSFGAPQYAQQYGLYYWASGAEPSGPWSDIYPDEGPGDVAIDATNSKAFFISSEFVSKFRVLDLATGVFSNPVDLGRVLRFCSGLALDLDGSVWAVCRDDNWRAVIVHIVDPSGTPTVTALSDDSTAWVRDLAVDHSGYLVAFGASQRAVVDRHALSLSGVQDLTGSTGGMHYDYAPNGDLYTWFTVGGGAAANGLRITSAATGIEGDLQTWSSESPPLNGTSVGTLARAVPTGLPGTPSGLSVVRGADTVLRFTAPSPGASAITGYEVSVDAGPWISVTTVPGRDEIDVSSLTSRPLGKLRLRAVNNEGAGLESAAVLIGELADSYWVQAYNRTQGPTTPGLFRWQPGTEPDGPWSPVFPGDGPDDVAIDATRWKAFAFTSDPYGTSTSQLVVTDLGSGAASTVYLPGATGSLACEGIALDLDGSLWARCAVNGYPSAVHITDPLGTPSVRIEPLPDWVSDFAVDVNGYLLALGPGIKATVNRETLSLGASTSAPELVGTRFDYASNGDLYAWGQGSILRITSAATGTQTQYTWGSSQPVRWETYAATLARAVTLGGPAAPTSLTSVMGDPATVRFTAPSQGDSAITRIEYSVDNGEWTPSSAAPDATQITIAGLSASGPHQVRVRAVNSEGAGLPSEPVRALGVIPVDSYWVQRYSDSGYNSGQQLYRWTPGTEPAGPWSDGYPQTGPYDMAVDATRNVVLSLTDTDPSRLVVLDLGTGTYAAPVDVDGGRMKFCHGLGLDTDGSLWARCNKSDVWVIAHITDPLGTPAVTTAPAPDWLRDFSTDPNGYLIAFGGGQKAVVNRALMTVGATEPLVGTAVDDGSFDIASNGDLYAWLWGEGAQADGLRITDHATGVQGDLTAWTAATPELAATYAATLARNVTIGAPEAPTGLTATMGDPATVSFTRPSPGDSPITGFEVSVDRGAWTASTAAADATEVTVAGLEPGRIHEVRVRAVSAAGAGMMSEAVRVWSSLTGSYWVQGYANGYGWVSQLYGFDRTTSKVDGPWSGDFPAVGPWDMAVDANRGTAYYLSADSPAKFLTLDLATGAYSSPTQWQEFGNCYAMTLDRDGSVWALCMTDATGETLIHITDVAGSPQFTAVGAAAGLVDLAVDPVSGELQGFNSTGSRWIINRWTATLEPAGSAPTGARFDYAADGHLYVFDKGSGVGVAPANSGVAGPPSVWTSTTPDISRVSAATLARDVQRQAGCQAGDNAYSGGSGTAADPYRIVTAADLRSIRDWHLNCSFAQIFDIDLRGAAFTPIGNGLPFGGTYDGRGHRVDGLSVSSNGYAGLFGELRGDNASAQAVVENLTVSGTVHSSAPSFTGGAGGVAGQATQARIADVRTDVTVSHDNGGAGGIVGQATDVALVRVSAKGSVSAKESAGGLAGYLQGSVIQDSYARGSVTATASEAGGLAGFISGARDVVRRSYATGTVSAPQAAGGLFGTAESTPEGADVTVSASFFNTQTTGQSVGSASVPGLGTGATTAQMTSMTVYTDAGWPIGGSGAQTAWIQCVGVNDKYPFVQGTATCPTVPDAPQLAAMFPGDGQMRLSFTPPSDGGAPFTAQQYELDGSGQWITADSQSPGLISIGGLTNGQWHTVRVRMVNIVGESTPSNSIRGRAGVASCSGDGSVFAGGVGTDDEPYIIATPEQLAAITDPYLTCSFKQVASIALTASWTPIGDGLSFRGRYDGAGQSITGLSVTGDSSVGLFWGIAGEQSRRASVRDLSIEGTITATGAPGLVTRGAGVLAPQVSLADLERISVNATVTSALPPSGVLVGLANESTISEVSIAGSITGDTDLGGIAGLMVDSTLTDSHSRASVSGQSSLGGLVGAMTRSEGGTGISGSFAAGAVTPGAQSSGPLVGRLWSGSSTSTTVDSSFYDSQTTGWATSAVGTAATTAQMKTLGTYSTAGWSIADVSGSAPTWVICPEMNSGYPILDWEGICPATPSVTAPTASGITYGDALSASTLSGGSASVEGTFAWQAPTTTPDAGTYPGRVVFTPADATNFRQVVVLVDVEVAQATPTITSDPTASGITYGQPLSASTLSGGSASVDGTFAWTARDTKPNAGTASYAVTFTPSDTANYTTASTTVSVAVARATPSITSGPTASGITYGQALSASTLSGGTTSTPGAFAWTSPGTQPNAGTPSYAVTFTPTDTGNYTTASTTVSVAVARATPTITSGPTASGIAYGQALSVSVLSGGTASVPGAFGWTNPSSTPDVGTATQQVTFTPTDASNYATVSTTVSVTVDRAVPAITSAPTASPIAQGQALSASALIAGAASVVGTFAWTNPSTVPSLGTSNQSVTFTPADAARYTTATTTVSVTVSIKATPTITTPPTASAITPGQALSASTLSGGVASVAGTFAWTNPSTVPALGTSSQSVTFTPTDTARYNTATTTVSVTVSKATPTITGLPGSTAIYSTQTLASSKLIGGTASVPGTFAWTTPTRIAPVGATSQSITFRPTDTARYATVTAQVSVTVLAGKPTTVVYTGGQAVTAAARLPLSATVTGPAGCPAPRYALDRNPLTGTAGSYALTPSAGTVATARWREGSYQLTATYGGTSTCGASSDLATLAVAATGNLSYGGGRYTVDRAGRVDLAYALRKSGATFTGGLTLVNQKAWRLTATVRSYTKTGNTAVIKGTGKLEWWNPVLNAGRGGWAVAATSAAFTATATGATAASKGAFGIAISYMPTGSQPVMPNSTARALSRGLIKLG